MDDLKKEIYIYDLSCNKKLCNIQELAEEYNNLWNIVYNINYAINGNEILKEYKERVSKLYTDHSIINNMMIWMAHEIETSRGKIISGIPEVMVLEPDTGKDIEHEVDKSIEEWRHKVRL